MSAACAYKQSDSEGESAEKTASIVLTFLHVKRGRKRGKEEFSVTSYLPPKLPRANLPQKKNGRDEILRDLGAKAM